MALRGLKHVIQVEGEVEKNKNFFLKEETEIFERALLLPIAPYESLFEMVYFLKPFGELSAFVVFQQVFKGVQEMHQRNIVHLDLKEPNLLLLHDEESKDDLQCANLAFRVVITDLGEARRLKDQGERIKDQAVGTPQYTAPEMIYKPKDSVDPFAVDVYMLGIVLFKMLYKTYPQTSASQMKILKEKEKKSKDQTLKPHSRSEIAPNNVQAFIDDPKLNSKKVKNCS